MVPPNKSQPIFTSKELEADIPELLTPTGSDNIRHQDMDCWGCFKRLDTGCGILCGCSCEDLLSLCSCVKWSTGLLLEKSLQKVGPGHFG